MEDIDFVGKDIRGNNALMISIYNLDNYMFELLFNNNRINNEETKTLIFAANLKKNKNNFIFNI